MLPLIDGGMIAAENESRNARPRPGRETHVNDIADAPRRIEGRRADPARDCRFARRPVRARCLRRWDALRWNLGPLGAGGEPGPAADMPAMGGKGEGGTQI